MKSHAFLLGAAVSLASAASFAADDVENPPLGQAPTACQKEQAECDADAAAAAAAAPLEPAPAPTAEIVPAPVPAQGRMDPARPANLVTRIGISAEAGGGFGGFVDEAASSQTTLQGQWNMRMVFGTRTHFAGEAAYVGSAQGVETLGVSPGATLTGNGLEGTFRFNVLTGDWQPYAVAGIGYTHYNLGNAIITTSDVQTDGNVATFPLGAGLAWRKNGIVLDGRVSFHPATWSAILRDTNLSTWDMNARAGFEF